MSHGIVPAHGRSPALSHFILLGVCFLLGIVLRRFGRLPDNAPAVFNGFVVHLSLPALTLVYVHELSLDPALIFPALMAWVLFGLGAGFFWWLGKAMKLDPATTGALILTGSLGNTSFIGLPMIETFYGAQGLSIGILIDQVGSYFVLSTLGIAVATTLSAGQNPGVRSIARKIVSFVPFQAFILALILTPFAYPAWLEDVLRRLGATLVPIALVSVGYQLRLSHVQGKAQLIAIGLAFKLIIGPALILGLFVGLFGARGEVIQITIFEAAMAPMIGASIIAMQHDLDPPLVTLMVGIGIPLSFFTLPACWYLLQGV